MRRCARLSRSLPRPPANSQTRAGPLSWKASVRRACAGHVTRGGPSSSGRRGSTRRGGACWRSRRQPRSIPERRAAALQAELVTRLETVTAAAAREAAADAQLEAARERPPRPRAATRRPSARRPWRTARSRRFGLGWHRCATCRTAGPTRARRGRYGHGAGVASRTASMSTRDCDWPSRPRWPTRSAGSPSTVQPCWRFGTRAPRSSCRTLRRRPGRPGTRGRAGSRRRRGRRRWPPCSRAAARSPRRRGAAPGARGLGAGPRGGPGVAPAAAAGWRVLTPAGEMVSDEGLVRLGTRESVLERRAAADDLEAAAAALEAAATAANATVMDAERARGAAREPRRRPRRMSRRHAGRGESRTKRNAPPAVPPRRRRANRRGSARSWSARVQTPAVPRRTSMRSATSETTHRQRCPTGPAPVRRARRPASLRRSKGVSVRSRRCWTRVTADRWQACVSAGRRPRTAGAAPRSRSEWTPRGSSELDREMARIVGADADLLVVRERVAAGLAAAAAEQAAAEAALAAVLASGNDERARLMASEAAAGSATGAAALRRASEPRRRGRGDGGSPRVRRSARRAPGRAGRKSGSTGWRHSSPKPDAQTPDAGAAKLHAAVDEDLTPALEAALDGRRLARWRTSGPIPPAAGPDGGAEPAPGPVASDRCAAATTSWAPATRSRPRSTPRCATGSRRWMRSGPTSRPRSTARAS